MKFAKFVSLWVLLLLKLN